MALSAGGGGGVEPITMTKNKGVFFIFSLVLMVYLTLSKIRTLHTKRKALHRFPMSSYAGIGGQFWCSFFMGLLYFKQLVFFVSYNRAHLTDWLAGRGQTSMPGGRYLLFPAGSSLSLELGLSLPIEAASGSSQYINFHTQTYTITHYKF